MGEIADDTISQPSAGTPGAVEGTPAATPSQEEIGNLYKDLGIKAPVPTGKTPGRPKANGGGAKKDSEQDDDGGATGKRQASVDGSDKSKTASASGKDGGDGGSADSKGSKDGSQGGKDGGSDGKVSGDGSGDEEGVRKTQSRDNKDASGSGEGDDDEANGGDGKDGGESEGEAEQGKRPGKSNPEVEQRFQKLTAEKKAAEERAEKLEQQLQQQAREREQAKVAESDPQYKVEDFKIVRDNKTGEIRELTDEQAQLAYYRWKEGYDQRAAERQAAENKAAAEEARIDDNARKLMKTSVEAYDALASLMDDYPELVTGDKFDKEFAADAMPIIQESIQYLEGTEPGNAEGKLPIIVGLKIDPRKILEALKKQNSRKRSLPLNGTRDNVESGSSVSVPHSRSSDPVVNQANELYKSLGINKRV